MKLLVIVLCLLSERYLIHHIAALRFTWFSIYVKKVLSQLPAIPQWLRYLAVLTPIIIVAAMLLYFLSPLGLGFVGFALHLAIFYYCLGPQNPFYPAFDDDLISMDKIGHYFVNVNRQFFAVTLWYLILGPVGALFYRITALCAEQPEVTTIASYVLSILDWVPARMTSFFYLLVGHFQAGLPGFTQGFVRRPQYNDFLLHECGLNALASPAGETIEFSLPRAEKLVEYAIWLFLTVIAIFCWAGHFA